ncbi:MAG: NAD(P)/FAD-dependent oxidoreductase [Leucobacter sp.]
MQNWDAIVLGGGAAGLSAALVLARTGVRTVVVEDRTPRNRPAAHMQGFISRQGMSPAALLQTAREEVVGFGGRILAARAVSTAVSTAVSSAAEDAGGVSVALDDGSKLVAPAILIATGLRDVLPDLPGAADLWGTSVHHCPHCHGREVAGHNIAVIGSDAAGGAMSLHQAALMRRYSDRVTFYPNGIAVPAHQRRELDSIGVVTVDDGSVSRLERSAGGVELSLACGATTTHDAVFIAPHMVPRDEALSGLGLARAPQGGWITVDATGRTSLGGVWAAGNISNPRAQVITAAGEGSAAAIDMSGYLLGLDLGRSLNGEAASWYGTEMPEA